MWLPVVVEEAVDKSWERRRSGTTKLVPLKALDVVPFRVSGIGALKSITDCYLAFQVGHRVLVARGVHVAVFILAHLLLDAWVVLMFPCVEEMRRPVTLAGRSRGVYCVLATWRKSLKAVTSRMGRSHNCS